MNGRAAAFIAVLVLGVAAPGVSVGPASVPATAATAATTGAASAAAATSRSAAIAGAACPRRPAFTRGPEATPRPTPDPAWARGVNLSRWDGAPDVAAMADHGIAFLYARATAGQSYQDPTHGRAIRSGLSNGLAVGSFHFFDHRSSGVAQAHAFVAKVIADGGFHDRLPPVLDLECYEPYGTGDRGLTVRRARAFTAEVYRLTGVTPMIYTFRPDWRRWLRDPGGFGHTRLWIACWACRPVPVLPTGWTDWDVWQIGTWRIPGIGRRLGANLFQGTDAQLRDLVRRQPALAGGGTTTPTRDIDLDLSRSDGVAWQARVAGGAWSAWAPWAPTVRVTLAPTPGIQSVRVRLRDVNWVVGPVRTLSVEYQPPGLSASP